MSEISPIPGLIFTVSLGYLLSTGKLSMMADAYFDHLNIVEQICVMALMFSTVFLAISVARFVDPLGEGGSHVHSHDHSHSHEPLTTKEKGGE